MADSKISGLPDLAETPNAADLFEVVDVSDTTDAATGTNKQVTRANLVGGLASSAQGALADSALQPADVGTAAAAAATDFDAAGSAAAAQAASQPAAAVLTATTASFTTADETKLDGIEALADVTPTADFATALQGAKADTATQPGDLAAVATTGAYADVTGTPTLGTAAAQDVSAFATGAEGDLAATALQPADVGTAAAEDVGFFATAAQGTLAAAALPKVQTIRAVATTTDTLVIGDMDNIVRSTGATSATITVPPASAVTWVVGRSIRIRGAGAGIVTLAQGAGVTVNATPSRVFRARHSEAVITYIGSDVWDASGDFAT